jgi:FtsP/CotA-like multicopper oxidase with cupredoxin domain
VIPDPSERRAGGPALSRRAALAGLAGAATAATSAAQAQVATEPRRIVLKAGPASARLRPEPAPETAALGYNGGTPGPVIRMRQGETVVIRLENGLDEATSLHVRGLRGDSAMDGVAGLTQPAVPPGGSFEYRLTPRDAGTFLYHPLVPGRSSAQVERGLCGLLVVEEPDWKHVDEDVPVLLDDWRLDDSAVLDPGFRQVADAARLGRLGNVLSVNGRALPMRLTFRPRARLRLRIGGAMNARVLPLRFEKMARATVISIDGQPCEPFDPLRRQVLVAPGSRYDVVLDLPDRAGEETLVTVGLGDGIPAVRIVTAGEPLPPRGEVPALPPANLPAAIRLQEARRAELSIGGGWDGEGDTPGQPTDPARIAARFRDPDRVWSLNHGFPSGIAGKPLFSARKGQVVVVALTNRSRWRQVIALHGHVARVLHPLDDGWEPYFMDTIIVPEGRTVRIAFNADNPGRWLIRSAVLEHMESGVLSWFEVLP